MGLRNYKEFLFFCTRLNKMADDKTDIISFIFQFLCTWAVIRDQFCHIFEKSSSYRFGSYFFAFPLHCVIIKK